VVGELFSSSAGLGYIISTSAQTFQVDKVFAAVAVLAIAGALLNEVLLRVESSFARWQTRR
jgi:ABC-type nitrate/sulfonate/bicarbonate transport system permease component